MVTQPNNYGQQSSPCMTKIKMGFMVGFAVGMSTGILFGGFTGIKYVPIVCCNTNLLTLSYFTS